jgi:hypothetical protein
MSHSLRQRQIDPQKEHPVRWVKSYLPLEIRHVHFPSLRALIVNIKSDRGFLVPSQIIVEYPINSGILWDLLACSKQASKDRQWLFEDCENEERINYRELRYKLGDFDCLYDWEYDGNDGPNSLHVLNVPARIGSGLQYEKIAPIYKVNFRSPLGTEIQRSEPVDNPDHLFVGCVLETFAKNFHRPESR